jgi:hypothetical protein
MSEDLSRPFFDARRSRDDWRSPDTVALILSVSLGHPALLVYTRSEKSVTAAKQTHFSLFALTSIPLPPLTLGRQYMLEPSPSIFPQTRHLTTSFNQSNMADVQINFAGLVSEDNDLRNQCVYSLFPSGSPWEAGKEDADALLSVSVELKLT